MENTAAATELLDGVVINEVGDNHFMLQRLPENSQLLGTELLQHHNGLVVDLAAGDFMPVGGYPNESLLSSDLTDEDKNLAAALVAVQFQSQQHKQQQIHEAAAALVPTPLGSQQLILSDKETLGSNGIYQIVGSDNIYVEKQPIPKMNSGRNFTGSFTRVDVAGRPDDDKRDHERQDHRTSRKSLPHKKRISRKLTKSRQTARLFPCNLCEQTFHSHDDFAQHQLLCQTTITPVHSSGFSCQLCNCTFQDQLRFFEHLKSHYEPSANSGQQQRAVLPTQQQQQQQPEAQQLHPQTQQQQEGQQPQQIQEQEQEDPSLDTSLEDDNIFGNLMNLTCIQCNKTFRREKLLEAHIKDEHDDNKNELENEFSETEDLMEGINVVVDGPDHNSDTDSKAWYREDELHQTEEDLKELEAEDHICHICKQPFPIRAILLQHLVTCRSNTGKSEPTSHNVVKKKNKKKGTLHCPECDKTFTHRNSLVYHMRSHTGIRPHQCDQCGKSFFASSALKVHLRLHSGDKPYHCDECGKKFRQWGDLKYHKTSIHSNEKQFQCEYCGKDFARKYSLIVHRRIHTGEKNYKCEYCNKTFRASSYLQNHRRIHTGEKPHECEICGKPFRVRSDMMRHQKTHSKRAPNGKPVRFVGTPPLPHQPIIEKYIKTESGSNLSDEVYELNVGEEESSSGQIMEYDQEQIEATVREGGGALYSHGHQLLFVSYAEVPVRNGEASSSWIQSSS